MGRGSYSSADWNRLKNSRGISASSTADDIFKGNKVNEKYLPEFINIRESRDSEDSPESTPIIIGFDSTGSMGYLAAEIAKNSLNKTATMILEKRPVTDPHIMCAAITSPVKSNIFPCMQVTQFEADIRVVEQLLEFRLDGGNKYAYDALVWYFALKHTSTDCNEKRGKKGFLFCIGDEVCDDGRGEILTANDIVNVYHDNAETGYKTADLYRQTSEKYEIIHIITGDHTEQALKTWEKAVPGINAVIPSEKIEYLAEVMISIMQLVGGMTKEEAAAQWSGEAKKVVAAALATLDLGGMPKPEDGCPSVLDDPEKKDGDGKQGFFSKLFK
ncbi:MAG: hypothetical protein Q4A05_03705 [Ruminococcus sp.]|nr:hypothetical protein [Ruminococcus sp.]